MAAHVAGLIALRDRGHDLPFTTRDAGDDRIVGSTRFLWLRSYFDRDVPDAVEIGGTWLAASAQRSRINTEAKLLMLTHAFETWGVQRVDLKTDARNERSRDRDRAHRRPARRRRPELAAVARPGRGGHAARQRAVLHRPVGVAHGAGGPGGASRALTSHGAARMPPAARP